MSLKAQTHFNTIFKVWVTTSHGERQQFGMLIFVHEKTSAPRPDNIIRLTCLLSHLKWLPYPCLILSDPWHAYVPALPCRCASTTAPISTLTPPYTSTLPPLNMLTLLWYPQHMPPMPPLPQLPLAILTRAQCPPNIPLMPPSHHPNPQCHLPSLRSCSALKMRL
ncbi:hypothetical protein O181_022507 [Austropuccinia psidii MF-1]|uniref:Uncharacterized protein n=1 Tax=Austropuccinia psidii MF-1 TaxID=1389203 RepID=A0A9Q3CHN3_9BASI|nr:hypothetical protein [Austropuccinia psidii MF-1]